MRAQFDVASCLTCHLGTEPFESINSHRVALARLSNGQMSCVNCHGPAHPTRSERTPGSADYQRLMRPVNIPEGPHPARQTNAEKELELRVNGPLPPRPQAPVDQEPKTPIKHPPGSNPTAKTPATQAKEAQTSAKGLTP
jgi:hypothetical protein